jgi:hypothetical protein
MPALGNYPEGAQPWWAEGTARGSLKVSDLKKMTLRGVGCLLPTPTPSITFFKPPFPPPLPWVLGFFGGGAVSRHWATLLLGPGLQC